MNRQKQAFTLVELIVVITILAILWTIAFLSLQWYSAQARDSKRMSDINNIKTSLELFSLQVGKYPLPDNVNNITYSWWSVTVWQQWSVWDNMITNLSKNLSQKPVDPLYGTEYIYSTIERRSEYEIMSVYEWNIASNTHVLNSTHAEWEVTVKVEWTYNQLFVRTSDYVIPTPSIITSLDISWGLDFDAQAISSQVINGWTNIPDIWSVQVKVSTWALSDLTFSVYNGSINTKSSGAEKLAVMQAIQAAYTGSSLATNSLYKELLKQETDEELVYFTDLVVLDTKPNSCNALTRPSDNGHITFTVNPSYKNQWYIKWSLECWFTCTDLYVWENCEMPPLPNTCGSTESITYNQATWNKTTIISNISNYLWCEITSYPDWPAKIAWLTSEWLNILVVAPNNLSLNWGCYWNDIPWATSDSDGMQNTTDIVEAACAGTNIAANSCRDIWLNWYLPAINELDTIFNNKDYLGFFIAHIYWSSTEYNSIQAMEKYFPSNVNVNADKFRAFNVRCSSRF